ncbi:MAG: stalk domain-containing protein [Bacillota bacterium]|nr:stalk domain-containing protein [Bacillota bacterium]MDW7677043.1 stalk domain-containing protein [Bacillota bacterium]
MNHQHMKKTVLMILPFFLLISVMMSLALPVNAESISDGKSVVVTMRINSFQASVNQASYVLEQPPVISNGRTLVPLRFFSEALGARVTWNANEKSILFQDEAKQVLLFIDQQKAYVNDQQIQLDVPPVVANGRTLVPVRLISEMLGYSVQWNDQTKAVTITGLAGSDVALASVKADQAASPTGDQNVTYSDEYAAENVHQDQKTIEMEVIRLVNIERENAGVQPLIKCDQLMKVADIKSKDMAANNYFSHTSPAYGGLRDLLNHYNVSCSTSGENIAAGQKSAEEVMKGWMNSPGHRSNILHPDFARMGVGTVEGGVYGGFTWTQLFAD